MDVKSVLLGTVAMLALATAPALAQDNQGMAETLRLDEIVLTGEKQARSIKDTASSVAVLTTRDLEESGGQDSIADAATGIANVTYVASGAKAAPPPSAGRTAKAPIPARWPSSAARPRGWPSIWTVIT